MLYLTLGIPSNYKIKMNGKIKYACPCCGNKTLDEQPPGSYKICPVCFWEDDPLQFKDPDYEGGANGVSLRQAQKNFLEFGVCARDQKGNARNVGPTDIRKPVKGKAGKIPVTIHLACGWPLFLVAVGGAVGGALGGAAYALNLAVYKSKISSSLKWVLNITIGITAAVLWFVAAWFIRQSMGH